ncbi:MAG: M16 family metallopeptidase [Planctomycetota bacterium]
MVSFLLPFSILNGFSPLKGFKKIILKNGLKVFIKPDKKLPVVSIQLWVKAGSVDETTENNGISHFLEHLIFKGTENYSVSEISRVVESRGGIINAGTSKEFTCYYIDIPSDGFTDAIKIIADVANQKATFPEDEIERERTVILEEIKRSEDNPENTLYETFNKQLFTVTPYKWRVIGTTEVVSRISREDLVSYYRKFYVPNNMVLVIAGAIEYKETKKLIKKLFGEAKRSDVPERKSLIEPVSPPSFEKVKKSVAQSYILLGFLGPEMSQEKYQIAGDVLSIILGSGRSSRLYHKLREEKQLVYSIGSGFHTQQGTGVFFISAVCNSENVEKVKKEVSQEIEKIITEEIPELELEKAKKIVKSHWYFDFETYHQQAQTVGYWALNDNLNFVKNYLRNVNKVNYELIKKFLKIYYTGLTTAVVEPL